MALNLGSPCFSRLSHHAPHLSKITTTTTSNNNNALWVILLSRYGYEISALKRLCLSISHSSSHFNNSNFKTRASLSERESVNEDTSVSGLLDDEFLSRVSAAKDADEVLEMIAEKSQRNEGFVGSSDCCSIIMAALDRCNAELALSVFSAMRSSFGQGTNENGPTVVIWKWARPDVHTYALLIRGLAASLRVSDAIRIITNVCRVGVSSGEEVPFGKIVRCPSCMIAIAVAQPQHGIQVCI